MTVAKLVLTVVPLHKDDGNLFDKYEAEVRNALRQMMIPREMFADTRDWNQANAEVILAHLSTLDQSPKRP